MEFNLDKGDTFDLTKSTGGGRKFYVGLGWDAPAAVDLDVSVFPCTYNAAGDPKLVSPPYFVFYNQLSSPCGGIIHSGDNLTGAGDGDDEIIRIDFDKLEKASPDIREIALIVTIHGGKHSFSDVKNAYIRIVEMNADGSPIENSTNQMPKFKLDADASGFTALQFGSLVKEQTTGAWEFHAVGAGFNADLKAVIAQYTS